MRPGQSGRQFHQLEERRGGIPAAGGDGQTREARPEGNGEQSAEDVLFYLHLHSLRYRAASELPYGTQKRVELARALASGPRLLLLDEPAGGLSHEEVEQLGTFIRQMRDDFELTILLVEHHMGLVMGVADRVHVLDFGKKIAAGTPNEVRSNKEVIVAYLGAET